MPEILLKLKEEISKLDLLLKAPQLGVFTWHIAVAERRHNIISLYDPRLEALVKDIKQEALNTVNKLENKNLDTLELFEVYKNI